jgi:hypothetical protein
MTPATLAALMTLALVLVSALLNLASDAVSDDEE